MPKNYKLYLENGLVQEYHIEAASSEESADNRAWAIAEQIAVSEESKVRQVVEVKQVFRRAHGTTWLTSAGESL